MTDDARLKAHIRASGPMSVAQYMTWRLHDAVEGYYAARPMLGEDGDFITAPLVSQMFGELIGLWAVETWRQIGAPARFMFVEVGPGDGTLMSDALRAARLDPAFLSAAELFLIDTSPPLREAQARRLTDAPLDPHWLDAVSGLPNDAPVILIANELLDCLPARQFVRTAQGWAERMAGLDEAGALAFGLSPKPVDRLMPDAELGHVVEVSVAQAAFGAQLGAVIARQGGAALLIDYGRAEPGFGDTLQAVKRHEKVSPLEPGADLTVHADFPAVAEAARYPGAKTARLLTQGEFLARLGVFQRADALMCARPDQAPAVQRQLARLTDADQMGDLFKVLAIYAPGDPPPPGFEEGP